MKTYGFEAAANPHSATPRLCHDFLEMIEHFSPCHGESSAKNSRGTVGGAIVDHDSLRVIEAAIEHPVDNLADRLDLRYRAGITTDILTRSAISFARVSSRATIEAWGTPAPNSAGSRFASTFDHFVSRAEQLTLR